MQTRPHVVVVGGGVSGLAAAYQLGRSGMAVTVLEGSARLGGKLASAEVAGVDVDTGAESVLARRPEALELISELGLDADRRYPATTTARLYSRGSLRAFPKGQVMGVPGSWPALVRSGVLSWRGVLRSAGDLVRPATPLDHDVSVRDYVGARMGAEVVDRLVEPLLAGVYAGRADELSLEATLPQIAGAARTRHSLAAAVAAASRNQAGNAQTPAVPVFATVRGGLTRLVDALAAQSGAAIETGRMVRELRRAGGSWQVVTGAVDEEAVPVAADGVLLACPAAPAARLLSGEIPAASRVLAEIDYASMAIVTLALPAAALPTPPDVSGFLVPARERRTVKAATFSSVKWPWLAEELRAANPGDDLVVLRCSIGRVGEEAVLQRGDDELVELALRDLGDICGVTGTVADSRVTRWGGALPQYSVGHTDRVARLRAALDGYPGIGVCGAAYDGVGIAACVAAARSAATDLAGHLGAGHAPGATANTTGEATR